jgi:hypothetical protein
MTLRHPLIRYIVLLLLPAVNTFTQTGQGTIVGVVRADTGAVISGAEVRGVHSQTRFAYDVTTDADGIYRLPYLNPGITGGTSIIAPHTERL